jgi:ABC-type transporter MlaC component
VLADGVSDLSLKRAQYTEIFEHEGFHGLIDRLNKETSKM